MKKNKMLSLMVILCLSLGILVACGSKNAKQTQSSQNVKTEEGSKKDSNVIKIGAVGNHAPYNYTENGELIGYEVDIWKEIAKRNNLKIKFVTGAFDGLFGMIDSGEIDTIMCQIAITDTRKQKYDFTSPYMYNPGAFLVHKDTEGIKTIKDLFGKKVGVIPGDVDIENYKKADPEGKIKQVVYKEYPAAVKDVENKRIDAVGTAIPQGAYMLKKNPNLALKVSGNNGITEVNAFPFLKNKNEKLVKTASKTIDEMRKDGTLKKLSIKWFGIDTTVSKQ